MRDFISLYMFNIRKMMGNWMTKIMFGIIVIGLLAGAFLYKDLNKIREINLKVINETKLPIKADLVADIFDYASNNMRYDVNNTNDKAEDTLVLTIFETDGGFSILFDYNNESTVSTYQKNCLISYIETSVMESSGIVIPNISIEDHSPAKENGVEMMVYYISIFVIYLFILLCGGIITGSVALERISKVSELLIYRVSPIKIIYSKVMALFTLLIGMGLVAICEVLVFQLIGFLDIGKFIKDLQISGIGIEYIGMIACISFSGIAVYTVLYIIVGMFIQSADQIQFAQFPIAAVALIAYVVSILSRATPDALFARISMYIPLFYPFVSPLRLIENLCSRQEVFISTIILLLFILAGNILMSKLFRLEAN